MLRLSKGKCVKTSLREIQIQNSKLDAREKREYLNTPETDALKISLQLPIIYAILAIFEEQLSLSVSSLIPICKWPLSSLDRVAAAILYCYVSGAWLINRLFYLFHS